MQPQLTFAPVLTLLLVTSFTFVGILSLWGSTSRRNWFWRTLVFLAALSPLLLVPAYEPFIAFIIQGLVVALGIQLYQRWQSRRVRTDAILPPGAAAQRTEFRFSLSTLLCLTALVAMLTPVAMKLPQLNVPTWASIAAVGASCGLTTLIAAQLALMPRKRISWPIGLLLCAAIGFTLSHTEWVVPAIVFQQAWPPTSTPTLPAYFLGPPTLPSNLYVWPITIPTITVLLAATIFLAVVVVGRARRLSRTIAYTAILLLAVFPGYILWQLMHPLPYPIVQLPSPNGYDDFVATGNQFNTSPILNTTVEPKSTTELAAEVAKFVPEFARVRLGLSRNCMAPVWPSDAKTPISPQLPDIQAMRSVARALGREAELAEQQMRFRDAVMSSIDIMRFGDASAHGGIVLNYLVAIAVEGIGQYNLYLAIEHLDANACREAADALQKFDQNQESVDDVVDRDRIYDENYMGWYGHLLTLLSDIDNSRLDSREAVRHSCARANTMTRLLLTELALRQYQLENGSYPDRLDQLVPKYLTSVPVDPFSLNSQSLLFKKEANRALVYSVGTDGDDDDGRASPRDSGFLDDGDIRLDSAFAPSDDEKNSAETGDDPGESADPPTEPAEATP